MPSSDHVSTRVKCFVCQPEWIFSRIFVIFLLRGNFETKFGPIIEDDLRIQKINMDQIRTPYLDLNLEMTK